LLLRHRRRSLPVLCIEPFGVGLKVCRMRSPDYTGGEARAADTELRARRRPSSRASQPLMRFQLAKSRLTRKMSGSTKRSNAGSDSLSIHPPTQHRLYGQWRSYEPAIDLNFAKQPKS
jgi:hypothetical protein